MDPVVSRTQVPLPLLARALKPVPVWDGWQRKADRACQCGVIRPDEDFEDRYSGNIRGDVKKDLLVSSFSSRCQEQTPQVEKRKGESRFQIPDSIHRFKGFPFGQRRNVREARAAGS